mmetsp:Transcript_14410/g.37244  ORF Transcript_14410/g.37244 Transcript_14410/m.37244 type:complete len:602 (-) Transcript_14410:87-1892(-)
MGAHCCGGLRGNRLEGDGVSSTCRPGGSKEEHRVPTELAVMTLNLQYFSSYPKDREAAKDRLAQVLIGPGAPDVICVQEGLSSRNVLDEVGFELCVCSAKEGVAESVHDMVYGDAPTLKACDPTMHSHLLCNQIYMRRGSVWKIIDRGAMQISRDLKLAGGGGRLTGKLAIRSMVWVRLQHSDCPDLSVFVLCAHITGGRFEDQYFVQQLAEERKLQLDKIISFFDNRPDAKGDDVGILVGDFNATSLYTPDGPMHGYYKASIASSDGVKSDAKGAGVTSEAGLEDLFKGYMISPFTAISQHGWTFAYDRQQVGYTSGFGHCIDHMAMNRSLQVSSTEVSYLTNQRFGGLPQDTHLPLTDHNAVKTVFVIKNHEQTQTSVFRTEYDFLQHLRRYKALVHISGFGCKQQYADPEEVVRDVAAQLFEGENSMDRVFGKGQWAACYGGDPLKEEEPDVAVLVDRLRTRYSMHLIAIQADKVEKEWGGVGKHVDAVYYYPTEYLEDGITVAWGGFVKERVVGTTRILLEVNPLSGVPLYWVAAGGGEITRDELQAAWQRRISILLIEARARHPQDPALPFGPCRQFWDSLTDFEEKIRGFRRLKS